MELAEVKLLADGVGSYYIILYYPTLSPCFYNVHAFSYFTKFCQFEDDW